VEVRGLADAVVRGYRGAPRLIYVYITGHIIMADGSYRTI
jgi:hypothetical protein